MIQSHSTVVHVLRSLTSILWVKTRICIIKEYSLMIHEVLVFTLI